MCTNTVTLYLYSNTPTLQSNIFKPNLFSIYRRSQVFSSQSNYALNMEVALDTCKPIELANLFKTACVLCCSACVCSSTELYL